MKKSHTQVVGYEKQYQNKTHTLIKLPQLKSLYQMGCKYQQELVRGYLEGDMKILCFDFIPHSLASSNQMPLKKMVGINFDGWIDLKSKIVSYTSIEIHENKLPQQKQLKVRQYTNHL